MNNNCLAAAADAAVAGRADKSDHVAAAVAIVRDLYYRRHHFPKQEV